MLIAVSESNNLFKRVLFVNGLFWITRVVFRNFKFLVFCYYGSSYIIKNKYLSCTLAVHFCITLLSVYI
jgi:hypothetical protein